MVRSFIVFVKLLLSFIKRLYFLRCLLVRYIDEIMSLMKVRPKEHYLQNMS